MHKLTDEIVRDMEDFVMTIGKATVYAVIAIMLAAGPVAAKTRKAVTRCRNGPCSERSLKVAVPR